MPHHAVPCHTMLCQAVLSCIVPPQARPSCTTLRNAMPHCAVPCCTTLCHTMLNQHQAVLTHGMAQHQTSPCQASWHSLCPLIPLYPQEHGLDFQRLLDASAYKEQHRQGMIRWGEERRRTDPGFFCRLAVEGAAQPVWVSGAGGTRGHRGKPSGH